MVDPPAGFDYVSEAKQRDHNHENKGCIEGVSGRVKVDCQRKGVVVFF